VNSEYKNINTHSHLLYATNLSHSFDYPLFKNINFSIKKQESIAIVGVSGSGKSTLLHILSSLLKPIEGEVFFNQKSIYKLSQQELLKIRREDFGIVFQNHYLFRGFSGIENLQISQMLSNKKIDYELLKRFKIDKVIEQNIGNLSGGEQQRLSIARVLIKKPKVIFADEPTGNLDENTAFEVMNELIQYTFKENAGIIIVTHNLELANLCNKIFRLENKELVQIK